MLNVTSAMTAAVRPYLTGDKTPRGDLLFAAVADEEAGGRLGAKHLVEDHWSLVSTDYLLTEVAYPALTVGGRRTVPVSIGEKGAYWSFLEAGGTPGHGSIPYGADNALEKMVLALDGVISAPSPAAVTEEWLGFVEELGLDADSVQRLTDIDHLDDEIDRIAVDDPALARYIHAATHLTISANVIKAGTKTNVIADKAQAELDIRASRAWIANSSMPISESPWGARPDTSRSSRSWTATPPSRLSATPSGMPSGMPSRSWTATATWHRP